MLLLPQQLRRSSPLSPVTPPRLCIGVQPLQALQFYDALSLTDMRSWGSLSAPSYSAWHCLSIPNSTPVLTIRLCMLTAHEMLRIDHHLFEPLPTKPKLKPEPWIPRNSVWYIMRASEQWCFFLNDSIYANLAFRSRPGCHHGMGLNEKNP